MAEVLARKTLSRQEQEAFDDWLTIGGTINYDDGLYRMDDGMFEDWLKDVAYYNDDIKAFALEKYGIQIKSISKNMASAFLCHRAMILAGLGAMIDAIDWTWGRIPPER